MLTIRLQRTGKRNRSAFRVVLAQKTAAASKKFVEVLGSYNPHTKDFVVKNEERLKYWIAQHVQLSPTIHNLLVSKNIIDQPKVKAFSIPKKPTEPVVEPKAEAPVAPAKAAPAAEPVVESTAEVKAEEQAALAEVPVEAVAEPAAEPAPTEPTPENPA